MDLRVHVCLGAQIGLRFLGGVSTVALDGHKPCTYSSDYFVYKVYITKVHCLCISLDEKVYVYSSVTRLAGTDCQCAAICDSFTGGFSDACAHALHALCKP